ncbi:hypothetical protein FQA39_LY07258 [Lamprigera yunnana]|nr:hypothetical protein FQA39_LY07258 [Lamprigera yunnana]
MKEFLVLKTAEKVDLTLQWDAPASFNYTTKTFCRYRKCHQEQMLRDSIKTIIKEMEKPGIKKHGIIENEWIITDNITDDATMVASFPIPEFVDRNVYIINGLLSYKHYNKYSQLILSPITISFDDLMSKDIELSKDEVLNMNEQAYLGLMSASVETHLVAYFVRRNIRQFYVLFNKLNVVSETKKVFYVDGLTELINSSLLIFEQPLDDIFDLKIYTRNTTSCQQLLRYIYKSVPDALILPKASKNILIKIQEVSNLSGAVSSNVLNSFQNKLKEYLNTIELQIDLVEKFCNIELDKISSDLLKSNEEIGLPVCINEYKKFRSELSKLEKEADVLMDVICKVAEDVNLEGDVGVDDENKDDNNMI